MNRRAAIVLISCAVVVALVLANHFYPRTDSARGSVGEWYALNSPYGNCARRYAEDRFHAQYELVICRKQGQRATCWERPVGLQTLTGGFHKVDLQRRRFDAGCKTAQDELARDGLRP